MAKATTAERKAEGTRRPWWRRLLKGLGIALAIPVGLVVVAVLLLHTDFVQNKIREKVVERVGERVNGSFEIGSLHFALFGDIGLGDVHIKSEEGREVIALASLEVQPDWSRLLGGEIAIELVSLEGLHLTLSEDEDGVLDIKRLFKKSPPKPEQPKDKRELHVVVDRLHLSDVDVTVLKHDGTRIALNDLSLDGSLDAFPSSKTARVLLSIAAGFELEKPKDGLTVAVDGLQTGVDVDLRDGAGTVALTETKAHVRLSQKEHPDRSLDIGLSGVKLDIAPGKLDATLEGLALGVLVLGSIEIHGNLGEAGLEGDQEAQLVGLRIDAAKVNELLEKELLLSDVRIDTSLKGPPGKVVVTTEVASAGLNLTLDGTVDASDPAAPIYDLSLTADDIDPGKLVRSDKLPPLTVEHLRLGLRGAGRSKEEAEVDVGLHLSGIHVKEHTVDDLLLAGRYDGGEITLEPLQIQAYGLRVDVRGWVDLLSKQVDARLTLAGDVGDALARLREAGLKVSAQLPRGAVVFRGEVLRAQLKGDLEGMLEGDLAIDDLALAGGVVHASAHAELFRNIAAGPDEKPGKKPVELRDLDAVVELRNINLKQALALRGKKLDGLTGTVSGKIVVDEVPDRPQVDYRLEVRTQATDELRLDPKMPQLVIAARGYATKTDASLNLDVRGVDGPKSDDLVRLRVKAPLQISDSYRGLAPNRPLAINLTVPKRELADLLPYLPARLLVDPKTGAKKKIPSGSVFARIEVAGTAAAPEGKVDVDLQVAALGKKIQRLTLEGDLSNHAPAVAFETSVNAWLDAAGKRALEGKARVDLSRSPLLPGPRDLSWKVDLDLPPLLLAELPLPADKLAGLSGQAKAGIHLAGNASDLGGRIDVALEQAKRNGKGPVDVHLGVGIDPAVTRINLDAAVAGTRVLDAKGTLARPGRGLLAALRDKTPGKSTAAKLGDPAIDITLDVPDHSPRTYVAFAPMNPLLMTIPGLIGGAIHVGGRMSAPVADGAVTYDRFDTLNGGPGRAALVLDAGLEQIVARIELGDLQSPSAKDGAPPLTLAVDLPRAAIAPYLAAKKCHTAQPPSDEACAEGVTLPISARIDDQPVDVRDVVPAWAAADWKLRGKLDWKLDGHLVLDPKPRFIEVAGAPLQLPPLSPETKLDGSFLFDQGFVALPGTKRSYHDVRVTIHHDAGGVRVDAISARESDVEKPNRKLDIHGKLDLASFRPGGLALEVKAEDWLVFGKGMVGRPDAPRATLDTLIEVKGDLSQPIKTVDVDIPKLVLLIPDRFDRAHQPEDTSTGDLIYIDDDHPIPGRLPVPKREAAPGESAAASDKLPEGPERGLDVRVRLGDQVHVMLPNPMNLFPVGEIAIRKRDSGVRVAGDLKVVKGDLALGGRRHDLQRGRIYFLEGECAGGCLDLLFARKEHDATLRDISEASGGETVNIRLEGPISNRRTTLSGAGSPGTLYDLLSVHNAGRPRFASQPDMPATATVQYPQQNNLLLMSYLAVNVPHLLFLDKVAAWSDIYDGRGTATYGQVQHFEAEGYNAEGNLRVRGVTRPPEAGASQAELQLDWLWSHTPQTAFGVGIGAGDRLGGGPGVFFEWSSKD